jgi:hypothetical protein
VSVVVLTECHSGDSIEEDEKVGVYCTHEHKRYAHRELVRKRKGEQALGRSRRGCEDGIETNIKEIGTKGVD